MFKKICIFMAALFTMLISCAGPFIVNTSAAIADISSFDKFVSYTGFNRDSTDYYYCYFTIDYTRDGDNNTIGVCVTYLKNDDCPYYIEYSNNILIVRSLEFFNSLDYAFADTYLDGHIIRRDGYALQLDFNNNTGYIIDTQSRYEGFTFGDITTFTFDNFDTTFSEYEPLNPLDLEVSFKPSLSGTVSRTQTIEGKQFTSTNLDMYVTNKGSEDAQFAMFIVPSGGSVTFPSTNLNNSGFNPDGVVFAYVADEWSTFNYGFVGTQIQAPCTWHSVPSGYTNQLYSIPWNQMDLTANTNYDCVVYACLNDDMTQINNVSNGWDMRGTFSVTSNLNDVQEIYRSTFSISDPATFNPDAINESGASHSWNQNTDNNALFNSSSAYRDDNGNIVIRGQTSGGNNVLTSFWDNSNFSINGMFGQYFMFLNGVFMFFPSPWQAIVTCGLITLVIIGILKAVT